MIVLIDTDVLVDLALGRKPYSKGAEALLDVLQKKGRGMGYVAWHTLSNFYYLVKPLRGSGATKSFLLELTEFVDVAATNTISLRYAAGLQMKDFEDAMQVAAAVACSATVIATRNEKDFKNSPVPASAPESLVRLL